MPPSKIEARPAAWPDDGRLKPAETALLIIDMQRDFCDPGGYIASMGYDLSPIRAVIPRIQAVRDAVAAWGGLVVQTREGHRPDLSDLPALKAARARRAGAAIGSTGPLGRLLVRDEEGWQIVPELAPRDGEVVVEKPGYCAFHATDLERVLSARGVRRLIFTGVTTDVCVHSTLRSAVDRGYECLLIEDACAATLPENHRAAIATITTEGGIFGAVARSAALCAALAPAA
ncbi:Nicotinamidase-related amidase [Tistlia consotensis]|uniref:Nicotinamidase-related amidase n=1 Tax=Tistlia consotensis USBA 355 TaxID=560819 RepID=A0A1Y6CDR3_9PROT|nr:isochorismatase family cysteine hydrolase [Tistlia consotensis]SMF48922.1 Nicotinamidase-related amidase [Tistlia consotensis USBA 355]SNR80632.1 Nicotinamidase-related amidase [Tistlia consotensis]